MMYKSEKSGNYHQLNIMDLLNNDNGNVNEIIVYLTVRIKDSGQETIKSTREDCTSQTRFHLRVNLI